jgi:hypothetical protein
LPYEYCCANAKGFAVPRPGAFAANFTPDVLNRFRDLCRQQGKQYTKVLQLLAELYLETDGSVLDGRVTTAPEDPDKKKRQVQVESLQNKLLEDLLKRVELLEKQKVKTDYELDRVQKSVAFLQSGLQEPGQSTSRVAPVISPS